MMVKTALCIALHGTVKTPVHHDRLVYIVFATSKNCGPLCGPGCCSTHSTVINTGLMGYNNLKAEYVTDGSKLETANE